MATKNAKPLSKGDSINKASKKKDPQEMLLEANKLVIKDVGQALQIYKDICMGQYDVDVKINAVVSLLKNIPDEGRDILSRWRDMTNPKFISNSDLSIMIGLLKRIIKCSYISSHERTITAVTLFNRGYIDICYDCFADLACDDSILINYRVEVCRYLFYSDTEEYVNMAQETLISIIEYTQYPSDYRYKIIAGYISRTGLSTWLNATKLKIAYNEGFVCGLQTVFFYNLSNCPTERILSGQHMLDMECLTPEDKIDIGNKLLDIAQNTNNFLENFDPLKGVFGREDFDIYNARADAADVILRLGSESQISRAREIIAELGFSELATDLSKRSKSIYADAQNVHNEKISESVNKFIEKIVSATDIQIRSYHDIHTEVCDLVRSYKLDPRKRLSAFKALNRINIDSAAFTKRRLSMADIFVHIWLRICDADVTLRKTLENRLVEELIDMGGTCGSGHVDRLVNVLSGIDIDITISWEEQIIANVSGRVNALIRDHPDQDTKDSISTGMLSDASEKDRAIYKRFIDESLMSIYKDMYIEFVTGKYTQKMIL